MSNKQSILLQGKGRPWLPRGACIGSRNRHVWFHWKDGRNGARHKTALNHCYLCGKAKAR